MQVGRLRLKGGEGTVGSFTDLYFVMIWILCNKFYRHLYYFLVLPRGMIN